MGGRIEGECSNLKGPVKVELEGLTGPLVWLQLSFLGGWAVAFPKGDGPVWILIDVDRLKLHIPGVGELLGFPQTLCLAAATP